MFVHEINRMIDDKKVTWECMLMYGLAMVYINGDYYDGDYLQHLWGVGKRVGK